MTKPQYVYWICDATGVLLLYVGRAVDPDEREHCFKRRTGIERLVVHISEAMSLPKAQMLERAEIAQLRPPFNKAIYSSAGNNGQPPRSEVARQNASKSHKGHKYTRLSEESREKLSASLRRRMQLPAAKAKAAADIRRIWGSYTPAQKKKRSQNIAAGIARLTTAQRDLHSKNISNWCSKNPKQLAERGRKISQSLLHKGRRK